MNYTNDIFETSDGIKLTTYSWDCEAPKGIVHIVHGMSEHAGRYDEFASFLNQYGYLVFSSDLRGHGKTAGTIAKVGLLAMENGWKKVVNDVIDLSKMLKKKHPNLPIILLGHSMGSFIARNVAILNPAEIDAYIFSATAGHPGALGFVGEKLSKFNLKMMGKKNRSGFLSNLAFGQNNKRIENPRTEKDWLTRDEQIVDEYINDPFCMQTFTAQFYNDLLNGLLFVNETYQIRKMDKNKPVLLFAGDMDPVGDYGKGPKEVYEKFIKAGIKDVTLKLYEGGRHEMLNEINREEVYQMILDWLDNHFAKKNNN